MRNRMYVNNAEKYHNNGKRSRDYGTISKEIADYFPIGIQKIY